MKAFWKVTAALGGGLLAYQTATNTLDKFDAWVVAICLALSSGCLLLEAVLIVLRRGDISQS